MLPAGSSLAGERPPLIGSTLCTSFGSAATISGDVRARAVALDDAWDPAKMNFVDTLRTADPGNAVYMSAQDGIQAVGSALFYLDRMAKDRKLGMPLEAGCESRTAP